MKLLRSALLASALLFSCPALAQDTSEWGPNTPYFSPAPGVKPLTLQQVENVRDRACTALHQSGNTENFSLTSVMNGIIFFHMGIEVKTPEDRILAARTWNFYAPRFVCSATSGIYPTQHLYKRAIELAVYDEFLIDWLLADPTGFPIDMSVVEIAPDGTGSTFVGYLDRIIADPKSKNAYDLGELIRLRRLVEIRFKGKRLEEMGSCERERRMSRVLRDAYILSVENCVSLNTESPLAR